MTLSITDNIQKAIKIITEVGNAGKNYFGRDQTVVKKRDRSLVGEADRALETMAHLVCQKETPDFGFCGEEFGSFSNLSPKTSSSTEDMETYWLLDPIDGTENFLAHVPLWSTLLALIHKGEPVIGCIYFPMLGEIFVGGKDVGARFGEVSLPFNQLRPCYLRDHEKLEVAHISTSTMRTGRHRSLSSWLAKLVYRVGEFRTQSDAFGYSRVLCGGIHAMFDPIVAPYDVAAIQVLFDETPGATFTTLHGDFSHNRFQKGSALATCSTELHQEILQSMRLHQSVREVDISRSQQFPNVFEKNFSEDSLECGTHLLRLMLEQYTLFIRGKVSQPIDRLLLQAEVSSYQLTGIVFYDQCGSEVSQAVVPITEQFQLEKVFKERGTVKGATSLPDIATENQTTSQKNFFIILSMDAHTLRTDKEIEL